MTETDLRLKALFAADAPPARDPAFTFTVLQRLERRRLVVEIVMIAALAVAAGGLLWAVWPQVTAWMQAATPVIQPIGVAVAIAAGLLISLSLFERLLGRPAEAV